MSKMDRFLVFGDWKDIFSPVRVCALSRPGSDHTPLLLKGGGSMVDSGPRSFRF